MKNSSYFILLVLMLACAMLACSLFGIEEVEQEAVAPTVTQIVEEAPGQSEPTEGIDPTATVDGADPSSDEMDEAVIPETVDLLFSTELDDENQPVVALDTFPEGVERIFGSFQLPRDMNVNVEDLYIIVENLTTGEWAYTEGEWEYTEAMTSGNNVGFSFDAADLTPDTYTLEVRQGEFVIASGSFTIEQPLTYENTPFTFTNPTVLETYQQGDYDPASEEQLDNPTFEDIQFYVETGRVVVVEIQDVSEEDGGGGDVYDQWVSKEGDWVIDSLNALPNEDGNHYLGLRNVETGEKEVLLMTEPDDPEPHPYIAWMAYTPNEPYCYPTTDYVAINLDVPPFDQLEVRQALAAATDREAYHDAWGWGDSQVAYSFIPSNSWGIGWGDEGYFSTLGDGFFLELEVDLGGWPDACAYCGECVDNDKMAADLIEMWESELGISIGTTSISHDQLSAPIVGQDYGMLFRAWTGSSWLDYTKTVIEEGHLMVPEGEYDRFMQLVYDAAMESDPQKQGEMIAELDRLLVQEWAIVIPLLTYEWCPDAPVTRADWDS